MSMRSSLTSKTIQTDFMPEYEQNEEMGFKRDIKEVKATGILVIDQISPSPNTHAKRKSLSLFHSHRQSIIYHTKLNTYNWIYIKLNDVSKLMGAKKNVIEATLARGRG